MAVVDVDWLVEGLDGEVRSRASCLIKEAYVTWPLLALRVVLTIVTVILREGRHAAALAFQIANDSSNLFDWRMLILFSDELEVV